MLDKTKPFSERAADLNARIEYRRAESHADKEAIYRLRYRAYASAGQADLPPGDLWTDPMDDAPHCWMIGLYLDGALVASARFHVSSRPEVTLPCNKTWGDVVLPRMEGGKMLVDATRYCADESVRRIHPELPYLTLRPMFLALEYFHGDYGIAVCLAEHAAFYRRTYGGEYWTPEERSYPGFNKSMVILGYDAKAKLTATYARHPFYRSGKHEQAELFGRSSSGVEGWRAVRGQADEFELNSQSA